MLGHPFALSTAVAAVLVTTVTQAAVADAPPVNCVDNTGCIIRLDKSGKAGRARSPAAPSAATTSAPPLQACIDPVSCVLGAAGGNAGRGNAATPVQAAQQAVSLLPLKGPQIGVAPHPNGAGLVALPVWLWTGVTPLTWGPVEQTTAVTGLAVVTQAQAVQITWDMGDGQQVVCAGPGTPYAAHFGNRSSPDCGYRYPKAGVYTITGTTSWQVAWHIAGTGQNGVIATTAQSRTTLTIQELQVVSQ